jgi:ketosteroid isomerase-like protein
MRTTLRKILLLLGIAVVISCQDKEIGKKAYVKAELPVIEETIRAAIGWAKNKDFNLLYSVIANDSNYLEVGPTARITKGFTQFRKNETYWGSSDFRAIGYEIRDLVINIAEKGDVAWYYCVLDDMNEFKGQPENWMNTRWTGVLEKRKGRWVIMQMRFSFSKNKS